MATNLFSRAAKFRKTPAGRHMTQTEAVQHLSKGGHKTKTAPKVTGRKAVGKKSKKTPRVNEYIFIDEKKTTGKKRSVTGTIPQKAVKIQQKIETLERQRSAQKSKQVKDVFALAINNEHAKLRDLQKQLRARR